jgi:signal peptidase I
LKRLTRLTLRDYGFTAGIALALALLIRAFVFEAYRIPSSTMSPTLIPGDTIFVAKWPVYFKKDYIPNRGDVVVFSDPYPNLSNTFKLNYIKRVVGLPGDTVAYKNGNIYLNGKSLALGQTGPNTPSDQEGFPDGERYSVSRSASAPLEEFDSEKVPEGSLFVIGDLRAKDKKRKGWGIIPISSLKGKAVLIWLSVGPPNNPESASSWIPTFRFERMLRSL